MDSLITYIKSDLYRYCGGNSLKIFLKQYFINPGFKFMVWHRLSHYTRTKSWLLNIIPWYKLRKLKYRFGYDIPAETTIGKGFYIGHIGGIVITSKAVIGNNCNISQGVTIGYSSRGRNKGYPTIGDKVYIGPGAVIIGNIKIGNNVAVGANAVVLDNIENNAVAVGVPAKISNYNGSEGYILNQVM
jgi:serine O-acetyltransferase